VRKLPSKVEQKYSIAIDPVEGCGNSVNIQLPICDTRKSFSDYLLGTNLKIVAILSGYDELDNPISVKIEI